MASCDRSRCPERLYASSNFQNGNSRDNQKLSHKRHMASFHRPERCVLSRAHTPRFSTFTTFPCRQMNISLQSTAIQVADGTPRVHSNCKRSKSHSSISRNSSSTISRRLVVKGKHQCHVQTKELIQTFQQLTRLRDKFRKIRARAYTKNRFLGYHFDLVQGKVFPTEIKNIRKINSGHGDLFTNNPKIAYFPDRCTGISRKDNTNGLVTPALFPVVPKNKLAISPVTRSEDPSFKPSEKASSVVEKSKKFENGFSFTSRRRQYPYIHRYVKPASGCPFRKHDSQWHLDRSRKNITYHCPRAKSSFYVS